jgi:predicted nucleic acid-binding protein
MSKDYLIDTNFASCLFVTSRREHQQAYSFWEGVKAAGARMYLSRIAIAEVEFGLALNPVLDATVKQQMENGLKAYQVKEIEKYTTPKYAEIRAALYEEKCPRDKKGKVKAKLRPEYFTALTPTAYELGIQENDLWLAAIATRYNMSLVSDDRMRQLKDVFPSLDLVPWR